MDKYTKEQVDGKIEFIKKYIAAGNAADGSKFDANANVSNKNLATLAPEIVKDFYIKINRQMVVDKITELFGPELAKEYIRQLEAGEIYAHDETSMLPYCVSVTLYPFLLHGMKQLGGPSSAPQHLSSFCGSFVNLVFAISSQFAGAVATVEFLTYFDHFARKDYGDDYLNTHTKLIDNYLQQVVYSINQPAAARGFQSVFWNISLYDQHYFESMFGDFVFPDYDIPQWDSVNKLQKHFTSWFAAERKKDVLTFPVVTAAMITEDNDVKDKEFADFCADALSKGSSFFVYQSPNADSLASCCRLRNEISDNTFSYSLGAGGVATGSINVITINMNRLVQDKRCLRTQTENIHKYQVAYRRIMEDYQSHGMLPVYDAGYISLEKQFLTIGINGMVEAAESLGYTASNNDEYKNFVSGQLKIIFDANKVANEVYNVKFNTEFVPAENLGVKFAKWDKEDGYFVPRDCYNSYFYVVEDEDTNAVDKFILHGEEINQFLDGGSALHLNLQESPDKEAYRNILRMSAVTGCNYFCTNVAITICNECGDIDTRTLHECNACGSVDVDWGTRVIGYLKRISSFSSARQKEAILRHYHVNPKVTVTE